MDQPFLAMITMARAIRSVDINATNARTSPPPVPAIRPPGRSSPTTTHADRPLELSGGSGLLVRDEASGNLGTASRFLEIPDVSGGAFSISAVALEESSPAAGESDTATVRTFHAGELLRYSYLLYNATADQEKRSRVTVTIRLYRAGQTVFQSHPLPLDFPAAASTRRRSASGTVRLAENLPAGLYHFQIVVADTLAPAGKPSTADGFTDFEIKP